MRNPLQYIRYFFNKKEKEVEEKETYTKEEVKELISDLQDSVYTAIKSSRFIFDVNDDPILGFDYDGPTFTKLLVDENKYLLFVRCSNELLDNKEFINTIKSYKDKYEYISDIVFIDYDVNISLVTAKMHLDFNPFNKQYKEDDFDDFMRKSNYSFVMPYNDYSSTSGTNYTTYYTVDYQTTNNSINYV